MSNLVEKLEIKEYKNFKDICICSGLLEKEKPAPFGNTRRRLEKELSTICKWKKSDNGNGIIVEEVYKEQLQKIDKRSKNNIFINSIEIILLFSLRNIDAEKYNLYFSNSKFYKILGLFNNNFENLNYSDIFTFKKSYRLLRRNDNS